MAPTTIVAHTIPIPIIEGNIFFPFVQAMTNKLININPYAAKEKENIVAIKITMLYHFFQFPICASKKREPIVPKCPGSRHTELKRGMRTINCRSSTSRNGYSMYE